MLVRNVFNIPNYEIIIVDFSQILGKVQTKLLFIENISEENEYWMITLP